MQRLVMLRMICLVPMVAVLGCEPMGPIAGGALQGQATEVPDAWDEAREIKTFQMETRADDPYSVNLWGVVVDDGLYVASGEGQGGPCASRASTVQSSPGVWNHEHWPFAKRRRSAPVASWEQGTMQKALAFHSILLFALLASCSNECPSSAGSIGPAAIGERALLRFEYREGPHGMHNAGVRAILEDSRGNVWFGTHLDGLARFDGREYEYFDGRALARPEQGSALIWYRAALLHRLPPGATGAAHHAGGVHPPVAQSEIRGRPEVCPLFLRQCDEGDEDHL